MTRNTSQITDLVESLVRLEEEKADAVAAVKEKYEEAKALGYNVKCLKQVVKEMREDDVKRAARLLAEMELDTYRQNIGHFAGTPFGAYLDARAKAAGKSHGEASQTYAEARARAKANEPLN